VTSVGGIDDCDESETTLEGVLAGDDVDWYRYTGSDAFACSVDPAVEVDSDETVQVCQFVECESGNPAQLVCPAGSSMDTSFEGRIGCCSASGFILDLTCSSGGAGDDSATIYFRVQTQGAFECVHYSLKYHF
jgi:hypothetical protein